MSIVVPTNQYAATRFMDNSTPVQGSTSGVASLLTQVRRKQSYKSTASRSQPRAVGNATARAKRRAAANPYPACSAGNGIIARNARIASATTQDRSQTTERVDQQRLAVFDARGNRLRYPYHSRHLPIRIEVDNIETFNGRTRDSTFQSTPTSDEGNGLGNDDPTGPTNFPAGFAYGISEPVSVPQRMTSSNPQPREEYRFGASQAAGVEWSYTHPTSNAVRLADIMLPAPTEDLHFGEAAPGTDDWYGFPYDGMTPTLSNMASNTPLDLPHDNQNLQEMQSNTRATWNGLENLEVPAQNTGMTTNSPHSTSEDLNYTSNLADSNTATLVGLNSQDAQLHSAGNPETNQTMNWEGFTYNDYPVSDDYSLLGGQEPIFNMDFDFGFDPDSGNFGAF